MKYDNSRQIIISLLIGLIISISSFATFAAVNDKGIVIIPSYIKSSDTFVISFESYITSDKTVFLYSYDQKNWSQFQASYAINGVVTKGFHDSNLHNLIFFKAIAYGYEGNISQNVLPYSDTVVYEYSPSAPIDNKNDFFASWTSLDQVNGQFVAQVKQRYEGTSDSLGNVYIGIYLSSDSLCSTSDTLLGESSSTLSATDKFDSEEISFSLPSQANSGKWYLCAIADHRDAFNETSESNNSAYIILQDGVEYTLHLDAPDVIFTPSYNAGNDKFSINWQANNLSSGIRFSYSYDQSVWTNLEYIDSTVANSGSGVEIVQLINSLAHTTVYFKAKFSGLDPDLDSIQSFTKKEALNYQPLSDDFFVTWAYTGITNGQFVSHITQRYLGESTNLDDVFVGIYLSSDNQCSYNDELLGETSSTLSSGDRFDSETISFVLPAKANIGRWYLCAIADNHRDFEEISESNNSSYIILEDGTEYTLDPNAPDVIFSPSYNELDNSFLVSWRSSNLSSGIRFEYSYDNQNWTRFIRIRSDDPDLGEGIRTSIIPDSLLHNTIYIKARFSVPDPDLINIITNFHKTVEVNYSPIVILLNSIEISGASYLNENTTANYIALAKYSDSSSKFVSTQATWSENSSYASIDANGLLNTSEINADTNLVIIASYTEGGITKTATKSVVIYNIIPVTLDSITISGLSILNENSTSTFSAIAQYSDGSSMIVSVNWSENSSFAKINDNGQLSTTEVESDINLNVSASYTENGITKIANKIITIKDIEELTSLSITGAVTLNENSSSGFIATAYFSDGSSEVVTTNTSWNEDSIFTSINNTGLLTVTEVQQNESLTVSASYTYGSITKTATKQVNVIDTNSTPQINLLNTWGYGQFSHIEIYGHYLFVSTYDHKIKILDFSDINNITVVSEYSVNVDSGDSIFDILYHDGHLYVVDNSYIHILNVRNVNQPSLVTDFQYISIGGILGATLQNDTLYATYWEPGVVRVGALDISNPAGVNLLSHLDLSFTSKYYDLIVKDDYLYLLHENSGVEVIYIRKPENMSLSRTMAHSGWFKDIAMNQLGTELYISNWNNNGEIIVADPEAFRGPFIIITKSTVGSPSNLQRNQEFNLWQDGDGFKITNNDFSEIIASYSTIENFDYVLRNNYIFGVNSNGLKVFEITPSIFATDTDSDGIIDTEDLDDDNDGLPDYWELQHSLNPSDFSDAYIDSDSDGVTNYQEYKNGTNPQDSTDASNKPVAVAVTIKDLGEKEYIPPFAGPGSEVVYPEDLLSNSGNAILRVLDAKYTGEGAIGVFGLDRCAGAQIAPLGVVIDGSEEDIWSCVPAFIIGRDKLGDFTGVVSFTTNDPVNPIVTTTVRAKVVPKALYIDRVDTEETKLNQKSSDNWFFGYQTDFYPYSFEENGKDRELHLSSFDIDYPDEICVYLNNQEVTYLTGGNDAFGSLQVVLLPYSQQIAGQNLVEFRQKYAHDKWGYKNIGLFDSSVNNATSHVVTRAGISKAILQAKYGLDYIPPNATGMMYGDVKSESFNASWIEKLTIDQITEGCSETRFCPDMVVTKEQLAKILLKAKFGPSYTQPIASGSLFDDVPTNLFSAGWIEGLVNQGITEGCDANHFCPKEAVTVKSFETMLNKALP